MPCDRVAGSTNVLSLLSDDADFQKRAPLETKQAHLRPLRQRPDDQIQVPGIGGFRQVGDRRLGLGMRMRVVEADHLEAAGPARRAGRRCGLSDRASSGWDRPTGCAARTASTTSSARPIRMPQHSAGSVSCAWAATWLRTLRPSRTAITPPPPSRSPCPRRCTTRRRRSAAFSPAARRPAWSARERRWRRSGARARSRRRAR